METFPLFRNMEYSEYSVFSLFSSREIFRDKIRTRYFDGIYYSIKYKNSLLVKESEKKKVSFPSLLQTI